MFIKPFCDQANSVIILFLFSGLLILLQIFVAVGLCCLLNTPLLIHRERVHGCFEYVMIWMRNHHSACKGASISALKRGGNVSTHYRKRK